MKTTFISRASEPSRRLILIFSGWSTTPDFYADLSAEGWDIAVVDGYTDLSFDASVLDPYPTVYLLGWSLGVRAAEMATYQGLDPARITAAFALNGTLMPRSDSFGIHDEIFRGTEAQLKPASLKKFQGRMTNTRDPWPMPELPKVFPDEIPPLREELRILGELDKGKLVIQDHYARLPWRKAFVSTDDKIFGLTNQLSSWSIFSPETQVVRLDGGHYHPFETIIRSITPDHAKIARRFQEALPTYDRFAGPQEEIARTLAGMLPTSTASKVRDYIEIGPGSGVLTRALTGKVAPMEATFIDLYPLNRFGFGVKENYIVGDAETVMETLPDNSADLIASASAIQWFADPARFFVNCARVLRPGGTLLCSTFLKRNLLELDYLRPSPLNYLSRRDINEMLCRAFESVVTSDNEIVEQFDSPRDLLLHLKNTGVGGGSRAGASLMMTHLPKRPTLTYRPMYILAK